MYWGGQSQLIKCEKTAETKAHKCWNLSIQIAASQLCLPLPVVVLPQPRKERWRRGGIHHIGC